MPEERRSPMGDGSFSYRAPPACSTKKRLTAIGPISPTADFVPNEGSARAIPGYFSEQGLRIRGLNAAGWSLTYVTPWSGWRTRDVTNLPDGLHVLTFGPRQIVVLDSKARRLAFLARGWAPIVVLEEAQ
jgi:hypothetical protein